MDDLLAEFERPRQETPDDKDRRRRLVAAVGIAGLSLVALGSLTTNAFFTANDAATAGFTTGTVDIAATPATVSFNAGNMAPGDTVYGNINVDNTGSLGLRYAVSGTATDADGKGLRGQLDFSVYSGVSPANCASGTLGGGTQLGGTSPIGAARVLVGNPSAGAQAGDRPLIASASEDLCFVADLPGASTGNSFQAATTTVTFTFDAEQTKNN